MGKVTIIEVASEARVSVSTVSRILRGVANYSYDAETQRRVRTAAQQLGYQPNVAAQLLRTRRKTLVGIVSFVSPLPHHNELQVAVRDELRAVGFEPVFLEVEQLLLSQSQATFPNLDMLAGLVILLVPEGEEWRRLLRDLPNRLPTVTLYPSSDPESEWVYMDMAGCILLAAEHLANLGHREIAFAGYDVAHPSASTKAEGWHLAAEKFALERSRELSLWIPESTSIEEAGKFVTERLARMEEPPSALICTSDELALCVLGHLGSRGWKLPEALSVVGVDGIHFGSYSYPPLTTVAKPSQEIARVGIERLMRRIENPKLGALPCQLVQPSLLLRGSTAEAGPASELTRIREVLAA